MAEDRLSTQYSQKAEDLSRYYYDIKFYFLIIYKIVDIFYKMLRAKCSLKSTNEVTMYNIEKENKNYKNRQNNHLREFIIMTTDYLLCDVLRVTLTLDEKKIHIRPEKRLEI
uniref:Uncharacterized protein n=1 Tax=Glossina brevipalpis TaxID=37001 RepID=A0A1A9W7V9_9MUSC